MSDTLKIKQPANNITEDEQPAAKPESAEQAEKKEGQRSLGSYTRRNFRPREAGTQPGATPRRKYYRSRGRKICYFCASGFLKIDYKDKPLLERYMNVHAKILSRRQTGNCAMHQRHLSNAIKRARVIAILPFVRD